MKPDTPTVDAYVASLPDARRAAISAVLRVMRRSMPKGLEECMSGGMICWQVPLEAFSDTVNKQPLMYAALASQKHHMALYLCAIYVIPALRRQLEEGYARAGITLDSSVGCIRFRKLHHVPLPVIGKLVGAVSMREFIAAAKQAREEREKIQRAG